MSRALHLRHYTHADLSGIRQTLLDVHADSYADDLDDPFTQRFPWFVDHWGEHPAFACVIAYDQDKPAGFAYGAPSSPGHEWWRDHLDPAPAKDTTFAVAELMVRPAWRKSGAAHALHETLLAARTEDLAALLVDTTHPRVQALYERWRYRKVGERRPFPDSPLYAVMLRHLTSPNTDTARDSGQGVPRTWGWPRQDR
ncbi:GNAT family N-acetyltransferase [Streptomyces sp. NPDC006512]|uniref:GNAT family N-acetyltransferase n=1 Tax=Streptomyces sp. NPDC006512 TaxID=3154307 RepID=UPI0033A049CA